MAQASVSTSIGQDFGDHFAGSLAMHERSRQVIPGGITHDGRYLKPFPISISHAQGAHKWDIDGNRLIDYVMGHGSLLFGHNDPDILAAIRAQLPRGTHYGAGHEGEVRWAEEVNRLVPSAEQVKFTGSGTEATLLAIRVARSFTNRSTVVKLEGHFHGWHDYLLKGERPPFESTTSPGIPRDVMATIAVVPSDDLGMLEERLAQGDVAALILEPSGGSWAMIPFIEGYLQAARDLATKYDAVLIFDEVITGFRWAPGGAQERYGVIPDMTTMAKIIAGGMPGGAVAGKRQIMEMLAFKDEPGWNTNRKVRHQGTYNASPVIAAAGTTCLQKAADPDVQRYCDDLAARLRSGFNGAIGERGVPGYAWGESSVFHLKLGESAPNQTGGDLRVPQGVSAEALKTSSQGPLNARLHLGMLLEGVDLFNSGGMTSVAHTMDDIDQTVDAFGRVLERMSDEGAFDA
ncbi:MAG: aspartate aminotransferase family protein [Chloroflexia bacterium]|nr:aspartate aminotransferase family protein [Chloroflexia bacterium]